MKRYLLAFGLGMWVTQVGAAELTDYERLIKPVLKARCYACHGVLKQEAGLRLDTAAFALKGGDAGAGLEPGKPDHSRLLQRVTAADPDERMPPEAEPLTASEIAALRQWIEQGAKAPDNEAPERDPKDHWSFRPIVQPSIPQVTGSDWPQNPIDALIAAPRESRGLGVQQPADRRVWLRRVTLDLIGLPPLREDYEEFLADDQPDAVERVVDRLLASPHYGERWGRHWMDVWRYSDWWGLGDDARNSQRHIWHWRDWIVESLNADKGYDQMLREMLAADELYPTDPDRLRAGGFLARQYFKFNRTSWMDETIEHSAKAMIGLTFNCAKCHDHKYDPFTQADYYRYRAIFEPYQIRVDVAGRELDFNRDGIPRPFDCNLDAKTYLHIRGDDRNPDMSSPLKPAMPAFLGVAGPEIIPVILPPEAIQPGLQSAIVQAYLDQAAQRISEKQNELAAARQRLSAATMAQPPAVSTTDVTPLTESAQLLRDDFTVERPDLWQIVSGTWSFETGRLRQSQDGSVRGALKLVPPMPDDFEVKLTYVPLNGQTWKSVGVTFDSTDSNEFLAYLSAYAQGPKAQFAYKQGNDYAYPPDGASARPIELGKTYELRLRVRGNLVNVAVNGEHAVAYRIPLPRQRGAIQLITYDAVAEFQSCEISRLGTNVMLVDAKSSGQSADVPWTVEQARLAVAVAEQALAVAELQPATIRARAIADQARHAQPASALAPATSREAARLERIANAAKAREDLFRAELELSRATPEKKSEQEAKLKTAKEALDAANLAIEIPGEQFTSLRGSLKAVESNVETEDSRLKPFPVTSTGRRSALAAWLTDSKHPLTARVAANHIWSRHFGRPIVPTVFDFGRKGAPPTHPELLDWLATNLMSGGGHESSAWSMKRFHRLLVTSQTYRLSSSSAIQSAHPAATDPENRYYWRMNPTRMESQTVRDALLQLSRSLDLEMYGPSIPTNNETSHRRSLYFVHSNIDHQKFLSMFDDASVLDCYRRAESIVPQQALALENSPLAAQSSQDIVVQIEQNTGPSDDEFLRGAFLLVLGVEPTAAELATCQAALTQLGRVAEQTGRPRSSQHARQMIVHALLNHNDFITIR